jgi:hypothetical protein
MIADPDSVTFSSLIVNYDLYAKWFTITIFLFYFFVCKQTSMGNINMSFHGGDV